MTRWSMIVLVLMASLAIVVVESGPVRQVGQVVSATCAPPNGTAFCVAGFVSTTEGAKTNVTGMKVIDSWDFSKETPSGCDANRLACDSGTSGQFGNSSFLIQFRVRSNSTSTLNQDTQLLWTWVSLWSMVLTSSGTLAFRFGTRQSGTTFGLRFSVESHILINDDQWHDVRFTRDGSAAFSFVIDGAKEENLTLDLPTTQDKDIVDISSPESYGSFSIQIDYWVRSKKYPGGVMFETVSVSIGEELTTDLFSFDTATGGNVVLGDFLVDKFGCARSSALCESCSFCDVNFNLKISDRQYFGYNGESYFFSRADVARGQCPSSDLFVPRNEGACCGQCVNNFEPVTFCQYRPNCMTDYLGAHECQQCGIMDARIKCSLEQSAECGKLQTEFCKLVSQSLHQSKCNCGGQIEKVPLVCSKVTTELSRTCVALELGVIDVTRTIETSECIGRNYRKFQLDGTRTSCQMITPARKRHGPPQCTEEDLQLYYRASSTKSNPSPTPALASESTISSFAVLFVVCLSMMNN